MAYRKPWWRYVTEIVVRTRGRCVTARKSNGDIHCIEKRYSWLWGGKTVDCGKNCLP